MLRAAAILANLLLLVAVGFVLADEGIPNSPADGMIVAILIVAPVVSLAYCLLPSGNSWLGLYFKRKAMEEQRRMDALRQDNGGHAHK